LVFGRTLIEPHKMTEFHHKEDPSKNVYGGTHTVTLAYTPPLRAVGATSDYESFTEPYSLGFVYVENRKLKNREVTTSLNTRAKMFFYDEERKLVHENVDARWSDTIEPTFAFVQPRERQYYLEKDIPAGGEQALCLVAKHKKDDNCFIFNLETYSQNELRRHDSLLRKGKTYIKIVLKNANPTNDDEEQWYELINLGSDFDITLNPIKDPMSRAMAKLL
jgi:isopenicillin N synthase-like dioxygenase